MNSSRSCVPKKIIRKVIPMHVKLEIIAKKEAGMTNAELIREYGFRKQTISGIWANKEVIKKYQGHGMKRCVRNRPPIAYEMEKQLMVWLDEQKGTGDEEVPSQMIRDKAKKILWQLQRTQDKTFTGDFKASRSWFKRFRERAEIPVKPESGSSMEQGKISKIEPDFEEEITGQEEEDNSEMDYFEDPLAFEDEDDQSPCNGNAPPHHHEDIKPSLGMGDQQEFRNIMQSFTQTINEKMDNFQRSIDRLVQLKEEEVRLKRELLELEKDKCYKFIDD